MNARIWCFASLIACVLGGCDSTESGSKAPTPAGGLPCTGLAIDCRMAFADDYNGTYQGSASGTFTLRVDIIGGIQGAGPGISDITGQVDEFGRVSFTFPDGSQFTGQFSADHHSISGTWKSSAGSGTFTASSATVLTGTGGTGGTGGVGTMPSAGTVVTAAIAACQKAATCGITAATDCPTTSSMTEPDLPQGCWDEELAAYQCFLNNGCTNIATTCKSAVQAGSDCAANATNAQTNPDFNPALTGISSFDEIVHLCTQCTTEAKACYNSADCKAYAVCVDACPVNDFTCGDACSVSHADGYGVYSDAATCQFSNC